MQCAHGPQGLLQCTMRFGSTAKVLLKCKLKYYRISECLVMQLFAQAHRHDVSPPRHPISLVYTASFQSPALLSVRALHRIRRLAGLSSKQSCPVSPDLQLQESRHQHATRRSLHSKATHALLIPTVPTQLV